MGQSSPSINIVKILFHIPPNDSIASAILAPHLWVNYVFAFNYDNSELLQTFYSNMKNEHKFTCLMFTI